MRSHAQEEKIFTGGLIVGANLTQVDGDDYYGYHKIGLHTGATVYVHFNRTWGASMDLLFSQKGSRGGTISEYPGIGPAVDKYFIKLNYIEVPITLHCILCRFDLEAGLSYARLLSTNEYAISTQSIIIDPEANRFNTSDFNYVLGVQHEVYKRFTLGFRFQYSAISIRPFERIPYGFVWGTEGQFNNMICLRAIYSL
jgi:hypothetical protein